MENYINALKWPTFGNGWQRARLLDMTKAGLMRFRFKGPVVFVAYAAKSKPGLGARILAYRRGAGKFGIAGPLIVEHLDEVVLEVVELDDDPLFIRELCKAIIARDKPAWNSDHGFAGRI